jgi:hypothetical protein
MRDIMERMDSPKEDIVERLREDADFADANYPEKFCIEPDDARKAADEIERLRAVNARYKRALDEIARHDLQFVAMSALRNA